MPTVRDYSRYEIPRIRVPPNETLLDRLEPVAFDGDEGFCDVSIPRPPTRRSRRTNRHVPKPGEVGAITDTTPTICSALPFAVHRS